MCRRIGLQVKKGRVLAVETSTGETIDTPLVVNASGPYAARVAAMAGLDLPVRPLRRQIFFTDPFEEISLRFPMLIDLEHGWYMRGEGKMQLKRNTNDVAAKEGETVSHMWRCQEGISITTPTRHFGIHSLIAAAS